MAILLKQSTSATLKLGPFVSNSDGYTAQTALTIAYTDVILSKTGGAGAAKHNTTASAHDTKGLYFAYLDGNDVGILGELRLDSQITGALPVWDKYLVIPANIYDSLVAGSDYLMADVENWANAAVAAMAATTWGTASNVATVANLLANADKTGYGLADGAITAAKIATDAFDADALAADAVTELQSGLATTGSLNSVAVNVAAILADTGTDGVVIADGYITAAKIAANAIDADALAADAVTEIQSGLATTGSLNTVAVNVAAILADTGTDGVVVNTFTTPGKAEVQAEANDALTAFDFSTKTVGTASNAPSAAAIANQIGQRVPDGTSAAGSVDWSIGLVSGRLRDEETATAATTATRTLYKPNGTESWGTYVVNTSASLASYITGTRDS